MPDVALLPSASRLRREIPASEVRVDEMLVAPFVTRDRELTRPVGDNTKRAGARRIADPVWAGVASAPELTAAVSGEMPGLAVVPAGVAKEPAFAIVLPLKFIVSTTTDIGLDVLPTRALPLSTNCAAAA
jgi:hypothetical protein